MRIMNRRRDAARTGDVAFMVTCGAYDDYTVLCVCADQRTARAQARRYNRKHPDAGEDARARVERVAFIG